MMKNLRACIRFLYPDTKNLALLVLLCIPAAFFRVLVPVLAAAALDSYLDAAAAAAGAGLAYLLGWLCSRLARHLAAALAADSAFNLRRRAFARFLSRKAVFPHEAPAAAEMILPAANFLRRLFVLLFLALILLCAAGFSRELRPAALAVLLSFPAAFLLARILCPGSPRSAGVSPPQGVEYTSSGSGPEALLRALPAAKAFGHTQFLEAAFHATASSGSGFRAAPAGIPLAFPLSCCAAGLFLAGFMLAAGNLFPALSTGTWFFCLFAVPAVFLTAIRLSGFPAIFRGIPAAVEEMETLFALEPSISQNGGVSALHLKGELDIRGLSIFSGDRKLLDQISLKVEQGQKLALVGFSSESLACFARAAARLCEYDEGELRIDGKDIRTLDTGELRRKIDFIPRDPFLFEGTLAENIRCGSPSASEEEILRAVTRLGRGDWLYEIPDGISTAVAGPGAPLPSWAPFAPLARALLKKPALCVIDEPYPLRDPLAETRMREAMYSLTAECTCLIIARRLSTLRQADRIIVFDGNKPLREGSHEELLAEGGLYAEIYHAFFRHQSPDYFHEILAEEITTDPEAKT